MDILLPPTEGDPGLAAPPLRQDAALRQAQFVATLSDELRTPLNSVLTLAKLLADNEASNLSAQQVDFAQTIYAAGTGLLSMIDDILDLATIDSERAAPEVAEQSFAELRDYLLRAFRQAARERQTEFDVELAPQLPAFMRTDGRRLRHLLRNLLAMAFRCARGGRTVLAIAPDGVNAVFEIRHRADGAFDCRHATGAVLSICRELAHSLRGRVRPAAAAAGGIGHAIELPLDFAAGALPSPDVPAPAARVRGRDEAVMLIAEGNAQVASVMLDLVRANGYQGVVAMDLGTLRVLLREMAPEAVLIGGSLLDIDGWSTLELLRRDPQTRGIPVSMNCFDAHRYLSLQVEARAADAAAEGMFAALDAAAGRRAERVLVAGAAEGFAAGAGGRTMRHAAGAADAVKALRQGSFDGLVVGPALDVGPLELIREIGAAGLPVDDLPIAMVEASPAAASMEIAMLRQRARLEDILGETALYLGRNFGNRRWERHPAAPRREACAELAGRTALIVDDDIYNVYAMTGALERQGMTVILAQNARDGIVALRDNPDVAVVLIDVTMPEIDAGRIVHAMRATHEGPLPIIAVTARSMPGDRETCIGAGASDVVSKPINVEQLLALLRTWLARRP